MAHIKRQLKLVWGVTPIQTQLTNSSNELKYSLASEAVKKGLLHPKDQVLIIGGSILGFPARPNFIQTMTVQEILLFGQKLGDAVETLREKIL